MPQKHIILPDLGLLYLQYSGHISISDQRALIAEVFANPLHEIDLRILSQSSHITSTDLDLSSAMTLRDVLSDTYADNVESVPWAQYATTDLGFGMARMIQSMVSDLPGIRMEVFREAGAALEFLGLSNTDAADQLGLHDTPPEGRTRG